MLCKIGETVPQLFLGRLLFVSREAKVDDLLVIEFQSSIAIAGKEQARPPVLGVVRASCKSVAIKQTLRIDECQGRYL